MADDKTNQTQIVVILDKISDFVVKLMGWVMLLVLMVLLYEVLHPLPECPPGYVRVRY